jgi:hypothetical protein
MGATRTELLPPELESLRQLSRGSVHKRIPEVHGEKLIRCGFAAIRGDVLVITTRGYAKLTFEVTRSSWFATPV